MDKILLWKTMEKYDVFSCLWNNAINIVRKAQLRYHILDIKKLQCFLCNVVEFADLTMHNRSKADIKISFFMTILLPFIKSIAFWRPILYNNRK